jgi:hypothetical protein
MSLHPVGRAQQSKRASETPNGWNGLALTIDRAHDDLKRVAQLMAHEALEVFTQKANGQSDSGSSV